MSAAAPGCVICVGHAALDRIYTVDAWPQHSAKIAAHRFEESGGGMAANAAMAITRLGGRAVFWGPTGCHRRRHPGAVPRRKRGCRLVEALPWLLVLASAVLIDARGERLVVGLRGSALQAPADWLPLEQIGCARALLADVRWPAGARSALRAARHAGIPAILDADAAPPDILATLVPLADHIVFSQRGLEVYGGTDSEAALRRALAQGAAVAAVTQGEAGVCWIEAGAAHEVRRCAAFAVAVVDTLAARDIFHGAYALALSAGCSTAQAMHFAAAAAAIKCSRPGGRRGAPSRQEVDALLAQTTADAR